nr:ROK family transcriptional regulator [Mammaliicoccus sp. Marseille-Q6498]
MSRIKTKKQIQILEKILTEIYTKGPISRVDISRNTGITAATVTETTSQLIEEKLIEEVGTYNQCEKKSGRKKILLTICNKHSYYIGLEFARDAITFSLTDNLGEVVTTKSIPLDSLYDESSQDVVMISDAINAFIDEHASYNPRCIGIAVPGHYDSQKQQIATNNEYWNRFNLKKLLDTINLPVYLENNVHCMSLYVQYINKNPENHNFVFFHASKGIFASNFYNGNLYGQQNFTVGEVGHTIIQPDGALCKCGRRGCLQTYLGEDQLLEKAKLLYFSSTTNYLHHLVSREEDIQLSTIINAYLLGDEGCIKIIKDAFRGLAITLNNLIMMMDTEKIYIHGPLISNSTVNYLLDEYMDYENLFSDSNEYNIEIKPFSKQNGSLGACALAIRNHLIMSLDINN